MLDQPVPSQGPDHAAEAKMRLGVWMFIVYALIYAGFVAINVIHPVLMETRILFGMNLAVVYGFGLIVFALVLALIYNRSCSRKEREAAEAADREEGE